MSSEHADIISARSYVQGSPEWLFARQGRMTASLAAAALGLSPWTSPQSCYRQIVGLEEVSVNWLMEHGREHEPITVGLYEQETTYSCETTGLWIHPVETWLAASPDRLVGDSGLCEVKCSGKTYDEPPDWWWAQCQVQLICTGREWCDVVHYRDGVIRVWRIMPEDHELLILQLGDFMRKYVIPQKQPSRGEVKRRCRRPAVPPA
jgi:putative phage-type endonuclease